MRQNEQLKTINPSHAIASFLIFMSLFTASSSLQGALKKQSPKKNYVVRIFFRDFYDRKKNGKYDTKSVYNKSGFNENAKWDSILLLLQIVNTQKPKAWWFNNTDAPSSMVVLFRTKN